MKRTVIQHDGVALSLCETGEGAPFLFQHGLCGAAGQPAEVFPTDAGFQCLTLECRGHGQSQAGELNLLSIATFADDIADVIRTQIKSPVVIGGISMGAAIASRIAVHHPELVRALVLARPAWLAEAAPENMRPNLEVGELLKSHAPEDALRIFKASATHQRLSREAPDNLVSLLGFFQRLPIAVTSALLRQISADGPGITRAQLAAITVPTLVIGHGRDAVHPLSMAQELASLIPASRLAIITPKADDVNAYRADFRATLSNFLKEVS